MHPASSFGLATTPSTFVAFLYISYRPVVFIGPFEHHSNILPWRESGAEVVQIAENAAGGLDMEDLQRNLKLYSRRSLKIGELRLPAFTYCKLTAIETPKAHTQSSMCFPTPPSP